MEHSLAPFTLPPFTAQMVSRTASWGFLPKLTWAGQELPPALRVPCTSLTSLDIYLLLLFVLSSDLGVLEPIGLIPSIFLGGPGQAHWHSSPTGPLSQVVFGYSWTPSCPPLPPSPYLFTDLGYTEVWSTHPHTSTSLCSGCPFQGLCEARRQVSGLTQLPGEG